MSAILGFKLGNIESCFLSYKFWRGYYLERYGCLIIKLDLLVVVYYWPCGFMLKVLKDNLKVNKLA